MSALLNLTSAKSQIGMMKFKDAYRIFLTNFGQTLRRQLRRVHHNPPAWPASEINKQKTMNNTNTTTPASATDIEFAQNPEPRCACIILADCSGSMDGTPIAE